MPDTAGAWYTVSAFYFGGRSAGRTFAHGDTYMQAVAYFERLAADPDVREVWLTRSDGPALLFIDRRGRLAPGGLIETMDPTDEPLPDSPDRPHDG